MRMINPSKTAEFRNLIFREILQGKYKIGEKEMIVSKGLGTHTIPIRFNNKPELSVIHLIPAR